jgi:hypothetical protein
MRQPRRRCGPAVRFESEAPHALKRERLPGASGRLALDFVSITRPLARIIVGLISRAAEPTLQRMSQEALKLQR